MRRPVEDDSDEMATDEVCPSLSRTLFISLPLSPSLPLSISLSHTHTHSLALSRSISLSRSLARSLSDSVPAVCPACRRLHPQPKHPPLTTNEVRPPYPRGGVRPLNQTSTCLTQLTLGPYVVQIWSRDAPNWEGTKPSNSTEWLHAPLGLCRTVHLIARCIAGTQTFD